MDSSKSKWWSRATRSTKPAPKPASCRRKTSVQVLYHSGNRAIEHVVIPWCEENGVAVVANSSFGHKGGFPRPHIAGARVLKDIAAAHDATPRQVVLRFPVRRPSVFAILKASSAEHAAENARAGVLRLSEAEIARIDKAVRSATVLARFQRFNPEGVTDMVTVALLIRLEAKPGKEADVESFLKAGLPIVEDEPATTAWFGIRNGAIDVRYFRCLPE